MVYKNILKRVFDIILSLIAIIILSPIFTITAILIRLKLGSPIFFKQKRPGLNEKIFILYKFRTMIDCKEKNGQLLNDTDRLTRFGRFLRATSLDELPELFNIIKGDMSIVGPRPLSIKYLPYYHEEEKKRHSVKPGLTGLAQINGRNTLTWEQKFQYDLQYVENVTFIEDFTIIAKTIIKVIKRVDIGQAEERPISLHIMRQKQSANKSEESK